MPYAIRSAIWFWINNDVFTADHENGEEDDVVIVTAKVNGGNMGLAERKTAYHLCERVFL